METQLEVKGKNDKELYELLSLARTQWCPLVDKMSKEQESLLWRLYELMREMD